MSLAAVADDMTSRTAMHGGEIAYRAAMKRELWWLSRRHADSLSLYLFVDVLDDVHEEKGEEHGADARWAFVELRLRNADCTINQRLMDARRI